VVRCSLDRYSHAHTKERRYSEQEASCDAELIRIHKTGLLKHSPLGQGPLPAAWPGCAMVAPMDCVSVNLSATSSCITPLSSL
jgi:hypothetical protein